MINANAAFDRITHTEFFADVLYVNSFSLVFKRGIARDDGKVGQAGNVGGQVISDAIDDMIVYPTQIVEWQHDNREARRTGKSHGRCYRRNGRSDANRVARGHLDLHQVATTRHRPHNTLRLVAKGTAYFVDALSDAVVADREIGPDRPINAIAVE